MKTKTPLPPLPCGLLVLFLTAAAPTLPAQNVVVPSLPKKVTKRDMTSTANFDSTVNPIVTPPSSTRFITYYTLIPARQWRSSDGKSLLGSLIAFEDVIVETRGTASSSPIPSIAPPPPPTPPSKPTVIRAGHIRLLVNRKPFEVPLDRLVQEDRDLIESIRLPSAKSP